MAGDIPAENPKTPDGTAAQQADDLSRSAMAEIAGYASVAPLTPKEWKTPGAHEAAITTSEFIAASLPVPGLQEAGEAGLAAKLFEGGVNLYRRITTAIHFAGEIETGTEHKIIPHIEMAPPAVPKPGVDMIGVRVSQLAASTDEATQLAREMYALKDPEAIRKFIADQFKVKGPRAFEIIESVINAIEDQNPFIVKFHVQPGTEEIWQNTLKRFTERSWGETWKAIASLEQKSDITEFVTKLANNGKLSLWENEIKAAISRNWIRPGTKDYWEQSLKTVAHPHKMPRIP